MSNKSRLILKISLILSLIIIAFVNSQSSTEVPIISYTVNTNTHDIKLYWKNDKGEILKSIQNLKTYIEKKNKTLIFAMNGGMFDQYYAPQGLYIENHKTIKTIDTSAGEGNFYMQPNGVFYISSNDKPYICKTRDFISSKQIKYATQSGPLLLVDGQVNPSFKEGSSNLNIRNGVGILPNNQMVFAISKEKINFYDFANYFKQLDCKNALYLDGFVSRAYIPEKNWIQTDGNFGVMIGVTKK
ncbi:MAG: phosphodiester glycosidase family protein [Bacteroidetes bacterium]|nr:phosphodiester glycosidase family protein [Bacteroidota bacterium]